MIVLKFRCAQGKITGIHENVTTLACTFETKSHEGITPYIIWSTLKKKYSQEKIHKQLKGATKRRKLPPFTLQLWLLNLWHYNVTLILNNLTSIQQQTSDDTRIWLGRLFAFDHLAHNLIAISFKVETSICISHFNRKLWCLVLVYNGRIHSPAV